MPKPRRSTDPDFLKQRMAGVLSVTEGKEADRDAVYLDRDLMDPDPNNPRLWYDPAELATLGESMKTDFIPGVIVRPHPTIEGRYMIVIGHRRWRAAGPEYGDIKRIRCSLQDLTDEDVVRLQRAENMERADLGAVGLARTVANLKKALKPIGFAGPGSEATWAQVAAEMKYSDERVVMDLVRPLKLPMEIQFFIEQHKLSIRHARGFLMLQDPQKDFSREKPNKNQRRLRNELEARIKRNDPMNGVDTEKLAKDWRSADPDQRTLDVDARVTGIAVETERKRRARLAEEARARLNTGDSHLSLVPAAAPAASPYSAPDPGPPAAVGVGNVNAPGVTYPRPGVYPEAPAPAPSINPLELAVARIMQTQAELTEFSMTLTGADARRTGAALVEAVKALTKAEAALNSVLA